METLNNKPEQPHDENIDRSELSSSRQYEIQDENDSENCLDTHMTKHNE